MPDCVQKVMMILRELSDAVGRPVPLAVLSERTGIHKSTLSHILKDLCDEHYVVRVSHTEGYVLGPETYLLTRYGRYGKDIIHECHPILRYINKEIGGTAVFAVVKSNVKYIIDRIADEGVYKDEGADLLVDDLYRTVTGRVILANIPLVDALDIWERNGLPTPKDNWPEVTDRSSFENDLKSIRRQECYYLYDRRSGYQWFAFAVPILRENYCLGSLGVSIRKSLTDDVLTPEEKQRAKSIMIQCREELEQRLRFEPAERER